MANTFKLKSKANVGTATSEVYVVPGATTTVVIGITAANVSGNAINATVGINRPVVTYTMAVAASGNNHYTFSAATDRTGSINGDDPAITMRVGDTIQITNNAASGHPLWLKTVQGTGTGNPVSTPAAANNGGSTNGVVVSWTPNTAGTYYYNCQNHAAMTGTITVVDGYDTIDLMKNVPIPQGSSLEFMQGNKIVLETTDKITAVSNVNTSLDLALTIMEIT